MPVPKAGATVVVPEKDPAEKTDAVGIATALGPIIASALTIIALIVRR
jgi:hypothetical protein